MAKQPRLTDEEIRLIRVNLESDARIKWVWSSARVWAGWISAGIITAYATSDAISHLIKKVFGGP